MWCVMELPELIPMTETNVTIFEFNLIQILFGLVILVSLMVNVDISVFGLKINILSFGVNPLMEFGVFLYANRKFSILSVIGTVFILLSVVIFLMLVLTVRTPLSAQPFDSG